MNCERRHKWSIWSKPYHMIAIEYHRNNNPVPITCQMKTCADCKMVETRKVCDGHIPIDESESKKE